MLLKYLFIVINTRELTKLQLLHLRNHHNTKESQGENIKCIYWRHYKNKFNKNNDPNQNKNT